MVLKKPIGKNSINNFENNQVKEAVKLPINSKLNLNNDVWKEDLLNGFIVKTQSQ